MFPTHNTEAVAVDTVELAAFTPLDVLNNALRFWWVIFLFTVVGGLAGFGFHRMNPPIYEAVGRFPSSLDLVSTGPLTQYEEDVALDSVGNLLSSTFMMERVLAELRVAGIEMSVMDLKSIAFFERKTTKWILTVRHQDLKVVEEIARIWMEQGHAGLLESYAHAIQAWQLSRYVLALENCLATYAVAEPAHGLCDRYRFADIQADLHQAGEALFHERQASRNLFYGLTIGPPDFAGVSPAPVLYGRNSLVLAGSLIGFLIGIVVNQLGIPARWMRRK